MKIKNAFFNLAFTCLLITAASAQTNESLPSPNDVVTKMMLADAQRQTHLTGYTAFRHYSAANKERRAQMLVRVSCDSSGAKEFSVVSEEGSGAIRKHVFRKMLNEEAEASGRGTRKSTRLIPDNYDFRMLGQEKLDSGLAYVLAVTPKTPSKYLIDGKIWVDATDFAIVRIEGQPARSPSFWVRSAHFVHTYRKVDQFWFASSTRSDSQLRIFGDSELTIENTDYSVATPINRDSKTDKQARLLP